MSLAVRLRRALPALESAAVEGIDHRELERRIGVAIARHLGYDAACLATVDPVTAMWTHCSLTGTQRDLALEAALFEAEYRADDVARLVDVARRRQPVAVLSVETAGDVARSVRGREGFLPAGFGDELRLVLVDAGVPWGSIHLLRARGARFDAADGEALLPLSAPLARLVRLVLLRSAALGGATLDGSPPGLVLVGPAGEIEEASPEAAALLGDDLAATLPAAALGLAARTRAGHAETVSAPTADGGWLRLSGTRLGARVAILVERARPLELASVVVRAFGLTPRERQIVERVAVGDDTREIAARLGISEWTVQDHLKSIFGKTGTASRAALTAALFFGHWAPEHAAGATPSPYGYFLPRNAGAIPPSRQARKPSSSASSAASSRHQGE